jgi:hypothetical protein
MKFKGVVLPDALVGVLAKREFIGIIRMAQSRFVKKYPPVKLPRRLRTFARWLEMPK